MHSLLKMCAVGLTLAATAAAHSGYLALVGPPPLRFESRMHPGVARLALPPLAVQTNDAPKAAEVLPVGPMPPPAESAGNTNLLPIEINIFESVEPPAHLATNPVEGTDMVLPQVWLKYFARSTNAAVNSGVIVPVGFLPPQTVELPASKAKYQIKP